MHTIRSAFVYLLVLVLLASPVRAGQPSPNWPAYAAGLPPHTLVRVELANGAREEGYVLEATDAALRIQPRTRLGVAARELLFDDIRSISVRKEGTSPGRKVLNVVAGAAIAFLAWGVYVLATWQD